MIELSRRKLAWLVVVVGVAVFAVLPVARAGMFEITIENTSPNLFTPVVFITHDSSFDLFDEGALASGNLERLAEDGRFAGVVAQANVALGTGVLDIQVGEAAGGGAIGPGASATVTVEADSAHPWLSFASMLAFSNDAFIGGAYGDGAIDLFAGGSPFVGLLTIQPGDVWDAGTEVNDELAASVPGLGAGVEEGTPEGQVITLGHPGIQGTGDIDPRLNWTGGSLASITVAPEPSTLTMLAAIGSMGLFALIRRKR
jgi:hypothetical protein